MEKKDVTTSDERCRSYFPADLAALLGIYWIMLPIAALGGMVVPSLTAAGNKGDMTLLWIAASLACIGVVILFLARRPLYRERRYWQFGPRGLDAFHKRLYIWAWCFLGVGISLLSLFLIVNQSRSAE